MLYIVKFNSVFCTDFGEIGFFHLLEKCDQRPNVDSEKNNGVILSVQLWINQVAHLNIKICGKYFELTIICIHSETKDFILT